MSNSPSRSRGALLRPGFAFCFAHPQSRGGRSAESGHAVTRHVRRLARRLASRDAGRSPLGAPPWRFWAPRAALLSPNTRLRRSFGRHPDRSQRAPRSQVIVPGGRGPCLPRQRLQAAAAGRHSPLPLKERGCESCSMDAVGSQYRSCDVVTKKLARARLRVSRAACNSNPSSPGSWAGTVRPAKLVEAARVSSSKLERAPAAQRSARARRPAIAWSTGSHR
jgi:hypothetical protein